MSSRSVSFAALVVLFLTCSACGGGGGGEPAAPPPSAFVGSDTCGQCHEDILVRWEQSGHPYKLTKIEGVSPVDSFPSFSEFPNDPVNPPVGLDWADISYTIGGYGWKMRWIDNDGYIVTSGAAGDLVQYNFENQTWSTYHSSDERGTKPYDCGKCHTTGWIPDTNPDSDGDLSDNQDRLSGMYGTFVAGGIHCEECHGAGEAHVDDPFLVNEQVDSSSAACGRCHTRDSQNRVAAKGGFIRHHEQYDEWLHSPHNTPASGCNDCHDPHSSVKFDVVAAGEGVSRQCEDCHANMTVRHDPEATCVDCHMPKAAKSAIAVNEYMGDIRTHIVAINTDAVGKADGMFDASGAFVEEDVNGAGQVSLDFACYGCHTDESGVGGLYSQKTLQELSQRAVGIHAPLPELAFVGSETCGDCHSDQYDAWADSGHPYKLTKILGQAPVDLFPVFSGYPNDPVDPPSGLGWGDVSYTIGGYGWKMRWMDADGYIVTSGAAGDLVQYNFEDQSWSTYHTSDEPGTKPYTCGGCHTTGWTADDDADIDGDLSDNQDGLPGIHGTFFAGGVHCEQCHGMGSRHAYSPTQYALELDRASAPCGNCHTRDSENRIAAKGGFIRHHEQYDEWLHSPHNTAGSGCNDCHDPHASVKYDADAVGQGMLLSCEDCHREITYIKHDDSADCVDCHMPKATKSAIAVNAYTGDIRTHIWAINTDAVGKADGMFDAGGGLVLEDLLGMSRVTLDFACYACHRDASGEGGSASSKSLQELSAYAVGMHRP